MRTRTPISNPIARVAASGLALAAVAAVAGCQPERPGQIVGDTPVRPERGTLTPELRDPALGNAVPAPDATDGVNTGSGPAPQAGPAEAEGAAGASDAQGSAIDAPAPPASDPGPPGGPEADDSAGAPPSA